ncbi:MAG TPA: glycosyltransferase family 2 protein [Burkholderiaceae bacterium]|nr:glycosyltransferase family 2 protein [Burkholderiaceae bacterium]
MDAGYSCAGDLELTVLMPCLNEALTVGTCVRKARAFLRRNGIRGEVLIADNGSTDGSQDIATREGARVVPVAKRVYGAALLAGIEAARGRYVIMGDSDDSYDFERLDAFVERLRAGDELVMGNRFAGGIAPGAMPWHHRYVGNPVLSFIGRLFFKSPVRDFHCGLRGFQRERILALGLCSTGMEFASEMVVKATLARLRIAEVPTTLRPDGRGRPPHLRSFRDGWRHLRFLLLHCPRWLFLYPGVSLLFVGWFLIALLSAGPLHIGGIVFDIHTMLYAAAAAILGLQLFAFSVISHMAAHTRGLIPAVPSHVAWLAQIPLEQGLVTGVVTFIAGFTLAVATLYDWAGLQFRELDPSLVMRAAIPAVTLMTSGALLSFSAFVVDLLARGHTFSVASKDRVASAHECR